MLEGGRTALRGFLCTLVWAWVSAAWSAQAQPPQDASKVQIQTVPVTDGVYVLVGTGGNIGVSIGSDGILLVDPQAAAVYGKVTEAVGKLSKQPIRFVLNSHMHADVMGGNDLMAKTGAVIVAHENVRKRLIAQRSNPVLDPRNPPVTDGALPTLTYTDRMTLHFNGDDIQILYLNPAHTDGDSVVYFRSANVLLTGDLFGTARYPFMTPEYGGSINGMIGAQEKILKLVNRDTQIIPGKGAPLTTQKEMQNLYDIAVTVRDRVLKGIRAGKTFEQISASKPTAEFDEKLTAGRGPDEFVKVLYQELSRK